jgi:hypothetical protein
VRTLTGWMDDFNLQVLMDPRISVALVLLASTAASSFGAGWSFADGDGYRDVLLDGKPVLRHMNAWDPARRNDTFKPYTMCSRLVGRRC